MSTLIVPQGRIPIGSAMIQGQRVPVEIDGEWMRWAITITERSGGTIAPTNLVQYVQNTVAPSVVLDNGDSGEDIIMMPGPQGAQGAQGPQGIPGYSGEDGGDIVYMPIMTAAAASGGAPGGATTQVQYNNAGAFAGNANFTIDAATGKVTLGVDTAVNGIIVGRSAGNAASNTVVGASALTSETTGTSNSAFGYSALSRNNGGVQNTAFGYQAGMFNTGGGYNTAVGSNAMAAGVPAFSNSHNSAFGAYALNLLTTGIGNTAVGRGSLQVITSTSYSTALGAYALTTATAAQNTAVGYSALQVNTSGTNNIAIGYNAGNSNTTGSNNAFIGANAAGTAVGVSNEYTLGDSSVATLRCQVTSITALSDRRDKTDIARLPFGLDFVCALDPITFTWNMRDGGKVGQRASGFIAQDLQRVQRDFGADDLNLVYESNPEKLEATYGNLIPVLVRAIQELRAEVDNLKGKYVQQ